MSRDSIKLMSEDKNPTLKISLPNGTSLIKFKFSKKEYERLNITNNINSLYKSDVTLSSLTRGTTYYFRITKEEQHEKKR